MLTVVSEFKLLKCHKINELGFLGTNNNIHLQILHMIPKMEHPSYGYFP